MQQRLFALTALAVLTVAFALPKATSAEAPDLTASLKEGTVELKSAGPLAFGPQGILFVGDPQAATITAIDTGDRTAPAERGKPKVEGIDEKIASLLGTEGAGILIKDLAVNPISGTTYFSVARGKGPTAAAVLVRLTPAGKLSELPLKGVKCATATIPNPVAAAKGGKTGKGGKGGGASRQDAITHIAYVNGRVIVAGLSNEEFSSKLRSIPFPFAESSATGVEIYHGAHGRFETKSPIRVFTTYKIKGEDVLLAAYQCTPLVKIPVADLKPGLQIKGTTVAELGNRNRPLSMIVYKKGDKDYVLMANNSRGLMKIELEEVASVPAITKRVADKAGLKYTTIPGMKGVEKLDAFGQHHATVLIRADGKLNLDTVELP